jgi:hypothetical protein
VLSVYCIASFYLNAIIAAFRAVLQVAQSDCSFSFPPAKGRWFACI